MLSNQYSGVERRQSDRIVIAMPATLRVSGGRRVTVDLRDISVTGFSCEYASSLSVGERLWLKFADYEALEVEVTRREGFYYGFCFTRPLHQAMIDHVVKRYGKIVESC